MQDLQKNINLSMEKRKSQSREQLIYLTNQASSQPPEFIDLAF